MTNPKVLQLLDSLRIATAQGRIRWMEPLRGHFGVRLKDATVSLSRDTDDDIASYSVVLTGSDREVVEDETIGEGEEGYDLARDAYEEARRSLPRNDTLIDAIIADLGVPASR